MLGILSKIAHCFAAALRSLKDGFESTGSSVWVMAFSAFPVVSSAQSSSSAASASTTTTTSTPLLCSFTSTFAGAGPLVHLPFHSPASRTGTFLHRLPRQIPTSRLTFSALSDHGEVVQTSPARYAVFHNITNEAREVVLRLAAVSANVCLEGVVQRIDQENENVMEELGVVMLLWRDVYVEVRRIPMHHVVQAIVAWSMAVLPQPAERRRGEWVVRWMIVRFEVRVKGWGGWLELTLVWEGMIIMLVKMGLAVFLLDSYQHWLHRAMYTSRFPYRHIHSTHRILTHAFACGALYNHPLEGFLIDTLGGGIPALILDMHPWNITSNSPYGCIQHPQRAPHLPHPANAFMLYRRDHKSQIRIHSSFLTAKQVIPEYIWTQGGFNHSILEFDDVETALSEESSTTVTSEALETETSTEAASTTSRTKTTKKTTSKTTKTTTKTIHVSLARHHHHHRAADKTTTKKVPPAHGPTKKPTPAQGVQTSPRFTITETPTADETTAEKVPPAHGLTKKPTPAQGIQTSPRFTITETLTAAATPEETEFASLTSEAIEPATKSDVSVSPLIADATESKSAIAPASEPEFAPVESPAVLVSTQPLRKAKDLAAARLKICREIYETESTYLEQLDYFEEVYLRPLEVDGGRLMKKLGGGGVGDLFVGMRELFRFHHRYVLPNLIQCYGCNTGLIGTALLPLKESLEIYRRFCETLTAVQALLVAIENDFSSRRKSFAAPAASTPFSRSTAKALKKYFSACKTHPHHTQISLQGFLVLPVQRLTRYKLFLDQLRVATPVGHPGFEGVEEGCKMIDTMINMCNEAGRGREGRVESVGEERRRSFWKSWSVKKKEGVVDGTPSVVTSDIPSPRNVTDPAAKRFNFRRPRR
ncbi:hypothetical protein HDV00_009080, partial [Rhizophlyctis rosea]